MDEKTIRLLVRILVRLDVIFSIFKVLKRSVRIKIIVKIIISIYIIYSTFNELKKIEKICLMGYVLFYGYVFFYYLNEADDFKTILMIIDNLEPLVFVIGVLFLSNPFNKKIIKILNIIKFIPMILITSIVLIYETDGITYFEIIKIIILTAIAFLFKISEDISKKTKIILIVGSVLIIMIELFIQIN